MASCSNCGQDIPEGSKSCPHCGEKLFSEAPEPSSAYEMEIQDSPFSRGIGCLMLIIGVIFLLMTFILVNAHFIQKTVESSMTGKILAVGIVFGIGLFFSIGGFRTVSGKKGLLPNKAWLIVGVLFAAFGVFFFISIASSNLADALLVTLFFFAMSAGCFLAYNYNRKKRGTIISMSPEYPKYRNKVIICSVIFLLVVFIGGVYLLTRHKANPLIEAAVKGETNKVQALLAEGTDVNARTKFGGTALMGAAREGHTDTVIVLLAKGGEVNAKDNNGVTALMLAALKGHNDTVQALLARGANVNAKDSNGATTLMAAAAKGGTDTVQALLEKGADVNAKEKNGITALMIAAENGHADISHALLAQGADVNAKNDDGVTALAAAAQKGHTDIVRKLIEKDADVNAAENNGRTALMAAVAKGHTNAVQALMAQGADVNAKTNEGVTALMGAAIAGHSKIVQALLAKDADVNAKEDSGYTALIFAALNGHIDTVRALLAHGADNVAVALKMAKEKGHKKIVRMLKQAGALEDAIAYIERGGTRAQKGDFEGAIEDFNSALEIEPRPTDPNYNTYYWRGRTWKMKGDYGRAIIDFNKALEIHPRYENAYNVLAWTLATCPDARYRDGVKAVELAQKAVELVPRYFGFWDTLAAAYAEAGKFEDAVLTQKKAIALLKKEGETEPLAEFKERLDSYKNSKPWREK